MGAPPEPFPESEACGLFADFGLEELSMFAPGRIGIVGLIMDMSMRTWAFGLR